jgi:hypothetical protein
LSSSDHTNPPRRVRSSIGRAAWPAQRAAWAFEERLVWTGTDAMRGVIDDALWPFERLAWQLRRRAIWPIEDRLRRWNRPAQSALAVALIGAAGAAGVTGAQLANSGDADSTTLPAPVVKAEPAGKTVSVKLGATEPEAKNNATATLQGASPTFVPESDSPGAAATADAAASHSAAAAPAVPATAAGPVVSTPGEVPHAALKVAHRFADAFVLYEIGNQDPDVIAAFRATAAEPLVKALTSRPPRQPASVDVPEAKVLNVVPGPRHGDSLEVSVSLLRVGDTSELRLHLERSDSGWLVTDVRG